MQEYSRVSFVDYPRLLRLTFLESPNLLRGREIEMRKIESVYGARYHRRDFPAGLYISTV